MQAEIVYKVIDAMRAEQKVEVCFQTQAGKWSRKSRVRDMKDCLQWFADSQRMLLKWYVEGWEVTA